MVQGELIVCGINGLIQFRQIYGKDKMKDIVHRMNDSIIHRGPDAEGLFADESCALGMRRLSIIDVEGGGQPIWNEVRDRLIIFNGELYNYRELREQLRKAGHVFATDSDTEVVLHGMESYGASFLKQMEGMFAFAYYDKRDRKWVLARDRVGEKPLYYFQGDGFFLFGSELKSLLLTGLIKREIDRASLSQYFQLTYIPAPGTILAGVYKMLPATVMTITEGGEIRTECYWEMDIDYEDPAYQDYGGCKKKLREEMFRAVGQRMSSDVPLGAFLSGGFDSAIIVGIMSEISAAPIDTFTVGFREKQFDESSLAERVARKNRTNHHVLMMDWKDTFRDLEGIINSMGEPFADSSFLATYAVSKMAREHVTVALTGDAGDELFAGYDKYLVSYYGERYRKIPPFIRKGIVEPGARLLPVKSGLARKADKVIGVAMMDGYGQRKRMMCLGFKDVEVKRLMRDGFCDSMHFIEEEYGLLKNRDGQLRAQYVDLKVVLEGDMLAKVDRASMLASLETRVPLLDSKVVEIAFKMPTDFKIRGRERKRIWKDTFRDLLPEELFHAPKHGFGVPIGEWLETSLRRQLYEYMEPGFLEEQGLFSYDYIKEIADRHMAHKENRYSELWAFYVFQHWYRNVFAC